MRAPYSYDNNAKTQMPCTKRNAPKKHFKPIRLLKISQTHHLNATGSFGGWLHLAQVFGTICYSNIARHSDTPNNVYEMYCSATPGTLWEDLMLKRSPGSKW